MNAVVVVESPRPARRKTRKNHRVLNRCIGHVDPRAAGEDVLEPVGGVLHVPLLTDPRVLANPAQQHLLIGAVELHEA